MGIYSDALGCLRVPSANPPVTSPAFELRRQPKTHQPRTERSPRVQSLNADELRPPHDWMKIYERLWEHQLQRLKARAEQKEREAKLKTRPRNPPHT